MCWITHWASHTVLVQKETQHRGMTGTHPNKGPQGAIKKKKPPLEACWQGNQQINPRKKQKAMEVNKEAEKCGSSQFRNQAIWPRVQNKEDERMGAIKGTDRGLAKDKYGNRTKVLK